MQRCTNSREGPKRALEMAIQPLQESRETCKGGSTRKMSPSVRPISRMKDVLCSQEEEQSFFFIFSHLFFLVLPKLKDMPFS